MDKLKFIEMELTHQLDMISFEKEDQGAVIAGLVSSKPEPITVPMRYII